MENKEIGLKMISDKVQERIDLLMSKDRTREEMDEVEFLFELCQDLFDLREKLINECNGDNNALIGLYAKIC